MSAFKFLDVPFVVIGAIIALVAGAPALGVIVGAAGWLLQRGLQVVDRGLTARIDDSLRRAGIRTFEALSRTVLLAVAIIVAGVAGGHDDGVTATVVILAAYTVAFVIRLMSGPPSRRELN